MIAITTLLSPAILSLLLQADLSESGLNVQIAVALLVISVLGYALVNTIEIAIVGASRIRIRHLAEEGNKNAQALQRLRAREDYFFSGIVLLQNLFVFLSSAMASLLAIQLAGGWGLLIATVIVTCVVALFGEVTPKVIAVKASDTLALIFARPVELLIALMRPITIVFAASPNLLSRVFFGSDAKVTPTVSEAELRMLIDIGAEEGAFGEEEAELMERVFRFYDRRANELMVPRTEVVWLESGTTVAEFYKVFDLATHSRFPVYRDTLDSVIGVINIKDVLRSVARGQLSETQPIDTLVRPAYFVPETKLVGELLVEMQERRQEMAVIVDEYGGTAGVVTLELLLEEMVGPVVDELGRPEREFQAIDDRTFRVDGGLSVHEAREELDLAVPEGDYETMAGYVLEVLGHIPAEGEALSGDGYHITISKVDGRKIEEMVVTRIPEAQPASEVEAAQE